MNQSIVDIPEHTRSNGHNKYNLQQLKELPHGKALRLYLDDNTIISTARGVVWNYGKRHELKLSTHKGHENGTDVLYVWRT